MFPAIDHQFEILQSPSSCPTVHHRQNLLGVNGIQGDEERGEDAKDRARQRETSGLIFLVDSEVEPSHYGKTAADSAGNIIFDDYK